MRSPLPRFRDIIQATSEATRLGRADILGKGRWPHCVAARKLVFWTANHYRYSHRAMSRITGFDPTWIGRSAAEIQSRLDHGDRALCAKLNVILRRCEELARGRAYIEAGVSPSAEITIGGAA